MTLEEAIIHSKEVAIEKRSEGCIECANEHEQLAAWLEELKDYREGLRTCENCRHECKDGDEYPCSICRCNHPNKFEWKEGEQNDT